MARDCAARRLLTDMSQCLGRTAGNALEVREAIDVLTGQAVHSRLREGHASQLAAELLVLGGLAEDRAGAAAAAARALELGCGGGALRPHGGCARRAGGRARASRERHLPEAPVRHAVHLERSGHRRGDRCARARAGRGRSGRRAPGASPTRSIRRVGLADVRGIGEEVGPDAPFAIVHAATDSDAAAAAELLRRAVERGRNPFRYHSAYHR